MSNNLLSLHSTNQNDKSFCTDDFSMFCKIAQSPSRSSSSNVSPVLYVRPRSKSMLYENYQNLLLPDTSTHIYTKRSPSPSRKSLGNLPVIKTMLKVEDLNTSVTGHSRRPSFCPMKDYGLEDDGNKDSSTCQFLDDVCHVRSFKVTEKGMINEGDLLISRSTGNIKSENIHVQYNGNQSDKYSNIDSPLKIQILGANGVGKTTLASQFMTSEQICCRMMSVNEETEKLFSIRIDGKEWNILLHDTCNMNIDATNEVRVELLDKMNAYIVLFAIDDLASFEYSKQVLKDIFKKVDTTRAAYLVGNKADLERSREVKSKICKELSKVHRCHFYEISTALNHKVDELLCKIIMDILKSQSKVESPRKSIYKRRESQLVTTGRALGKLLRKTFGTKSCEHIS